MQIKYVMVALKDENDTFVAASKLARSFEKSKSSGIFSARTCHLSSKIQVVMEYRRICSEERHSNQ